MESTEARITAHPGSRHEARRFQLLSLRIKVAQYRAMEQELLSFLQNDSDQAANGKLRTGSKSPRIPARRNVGG